MRRASLPAGLAVALATLGWLLLPLANARAAFERLGPLAAVDDLPGFIWVQYLDPAFFLFSFPFALLLWSARRGAPARVAWLAWDGTRPVHGTLWSLAALVACLAVLGLAGAHWRSANRLSALLVLAGIPAALALRALVVTPRVAGFVPAGCLLRVAQVAVALSVPLWLLYTGLDESYTGRFPSTSRAAAVTLGTWRADPAWRDTIVPGREGAFEVRDVFIEQRIRIHWRWWLIREVRPQDRHDLIAVLAARPPFRERVTLAALAFRGDAPPDTVLLGGTSSGDPYPVAFGPVALPYPDSLRFLAVDESSRRPVSRGRRRP